jgi:hypothetical protein
MRFAIHLDRNSTIKAREIKDKAFEWKLSPETKSVSSAPKLLPQQHFGKRHAATQLPSERDVTTRRTDRRVPDAPAVVPSTMLRMVPLPVPERIFDRRHALPHIRTNTEHKVRASLS